MTNIRWQHFTGIFLLSTGTLSLWTKLREEMPLDHALASLALLFGFASLARPNQSEVATTTRLANRAPIAEEFDSFDLAQAWSGSLSPRLRLMLADLVPWEPRGC
jgi:hypothetical protein